MFGKKSHLTLLASRKLLLIAESELNRAQLAEDMAVLTEDFRSFTDRVKSFGAIASSATVLAAGLAAFRCRKPAGAEAKPSWLQTVLKGAGLISTLWVAVRSAGRHQQSE